MTKFIDNYDVTVKLQGAADTLAEAWEVVGMELAKLQ